MGFSSYRDEGQPWRLLTCRCPQQETFSQCTSRLKGLYKAFLPFSEFWWRYHSKIVRICATRRFEIQLVEALHCGKDEPARSSYGNIAAVFPQRILGRSRTDSYPEGAPTYFKTTRGSQLSASDQLPPGLHNVGVPE